MDMKNLRERVPSAAWHAAANFYALIVGPSSNGLDWYLGAKEPESGRYVRELVMQRLSAFMRENPGISPETLFRFANGQGFHVYDANAWASRDVPVSMRMAYAVFVSSFTRLGQLVEDEGVVQAGLREIEAAAAQAGKMIPAAAFVDLPQSEALDRLHADPLALNPNVALVMTGGDDAGLHEGEGVAEGTAAQDGAGELPPTLGNADHVADALAGERKPEGFAEAGAAEGVLGGSSEEKAPAPEGDGAAAAGLSDAARAAFVARNAELDVAFASMSPAEQLDFLVQNRDALDDEGKVMLDELLAPKPVPALVADAVAKKTAKK